MTSLRYSNVSFSYEDDHPILHEINLEFQTGQIIGVIGPNGSGKSTLLKLANGLLRPQLGTVTIDTHDIRQIRTSQLSQQIHVTFQFTRQQFFTSSVEKEILVTLERHEARESVCNQRMMELISEFRLEDCRTLHPYMLSGGEQRRLVLALAMASSAQFFLLDEPTAGLDKETIQLLFKTLYRLRNERRGVIIVSHDIDAVLKVCDKVVVLIDGNIDYLGSASEVIIKAREDSWDFFDLPEIFHFLYSLDTNKSMPGIINKYIATETLVVKANFVSAILEERENVP
ncbi:MAG: energy-coupling factor ABC transporter ATP-binding protein [Candidatus Heimdallarchaeota archaeon]